MKRWVFLSVFGLFLLTGCVGMGGGLIVDTSYTYSTPIPPAHASTYRRSNQYSYYYYPSAEFYFDTGRNMYFYLDSGSQWQNSVQLPLRLRSHLSSSYVEIEMDDDRPYRRHDFYRNKYRNYNVSPRHGNRTRLNDNRRPNREYENENRELYRDNQRKKRHQYRESKKENKHQYRESRRKNKHQYRENKRNIGYGQKALRNDDYEEKEH